LSSEEACEFLRKQAGQHFSPRVVKAFFEVIDKIIRIRSELPA
jgi:response regulator RpfG family c-di-GMP phosphodiesterase